MQLKEEKKTNIIHAVKRRTKKKTQYISHVSQPLAGHNHYANFVYSSK
jgi:hypothetical protein